MNDDGLNDIGMYETFDDVSKKQKFFNKIFIEIDFPFSEVIFNKEDFLLATKITAFKFLGGYNDYYENSRKVYLNDIIINNEEISLWEYDVDINVFIDKNKKFLKEINNFKIKINNKDQLEYIKHLVCLNNFENI